MGIFGNCSVVNRYFLIYHTSARSINCIWLICCCFSPITVLITCLSITEFFSILCKNNKLFWIILYNNVKNHHLFALLTILQWRKEYSPHREKNAIYATTFSWCSRWIPADRHIGRYTPLCLVHWEPVAGQGYGCRWTPPPCSNCCHHTGSAASACHCRGWCDRWTSRLVLDLQ